MTWQSLDAEKNDLQPTPQIGTTVQWLPGGDDTHPKAAMVVGQEGPGRLALMVLQADQFPQTKKGVHFIHHPLSKKQGSPQTVRNGTWRYLPGTKGLPADLDLHKGVVAKKEEGLRKAEEDRKKKEQAAADAKKQEGKQLQPA